MVRTYPASVEGSFMTARSITLYFGFALFLALFANSQRPTIPAGAQRPTRLRCLIVGGGPDRESNPVALENNIIYVQSLLSTGTPVKTLYTDADLAASLVRVEKTTALGDPEISYRPTSLTHVDGPSSLNAFQTNLQSLSGGSNVPLLLYFTGHGSPDPSGEYVDNAYELWDNNPLRVSDLTNAFEKLAPSEPVTLVMVQCFSGAFAQCFFAGSTDARPVVRPGACGFFASSPDRDAAGCTPDINQASGRDFTSYFFGALTGRDRVGRTVPSADYDHDGIVEMDEAYCYTLGHDTSIDTPMATTDAYVRRFTNTPDREIFQTPYQEIV